MLRTWTVMALALALGACGSNEGASETADDTSGSGSEAVASNDSGDDGDLAADEAGDDEEPAAEGPDDGSQCLPVANCHSFANQTCARVTGEGQILAANGDAIEGARVAEACPGGRGVDQSVQECFSYVDRNQGCRRPPDVRSPEWPCAFEGDACRVRSF